MQNESILLSFDKHKISKFSRLVNLTCNWYFFTLFEGHNNCWKVYQREKRSTTFYSLVLCTAYSVYTVELIFFLRNSRSNFVSKLSTRGCMFEPQWIEGEGFTTGNHICREWFATGGIQIRLDRACDIITAKYQYAQVTFLSSLSKILCQLVFSVSFYCFILKLFWSVFFFIHFYLIFICLLFFLC